MQARSLEDGSVQWSVTYDDHVTVSPSVNDGLALAGDIRGVMRAIRISDGSVAWTFNPNSDDPDLGQVASAGVLTIADSAAIDAAGRAWVPYWNADMSTCCPPTDSRPSPFYLLDASTGEQLDKVRFDKAAHGPALHATGVWVGTDEGLVRHWSTGNTLQVHASAEGANVTLVTNTDRSGAWRIAWGEGAVDQGEGSPPALSTARLSPGEHRLQVTVGDASASTIVTIGDAATAGDGDGANGTGDGTDGTASGADGQDEPATGSASAPNGPAPGDDGEADGTDEVPLGVVSVLAATVLAAAWGRRRA